MGMEVTNFYIFAAVTLVYVLVPSIAVEHLKPIPCDDCCSYLQCLGMVDSNNNFKDKIEVLGVDTLCKPVNRKLMPICLSKSNLRHCSFLKKLIPKVPSQNSLADSMEAMCKQSELIAGMKNLTDCMAVQNTDMDNLDRCVGPYLNGMKDNTSNVCDVMVTMSKCMGVIVRESNCSDIYQHVFKGIDNNYSTNPFCKDTNGSQKYTVNFFLFVFVLFLFFILK